MQVYKCKREKCTHPIFKTLAGYKTHLLYHDNPEAYRLQKLKRKSNNIEEHWCEFPGCEKGQGGAKAKAYASWSRYSQHIKKYKDVNGDPWIALWKCRMHAIDKNIQPLSQNKVF